MADDRDASSGFRLAGTDSGFGARSNDIFSCLSSIEAKHSATERAKTSRNRHEEEQLMKPDPLQSSDGFIFRKPTHICRRSCRSPSVPSYRKHPSRWTSYDLSDVSSSQMNESSNTAAAFDFLRSRQKQREDEESTRDVGVLGVHTFHRRLPNDDGREREESTGVTAVAGKVIMPEYVVGKRSAAKRKRTADETVHHGDDGMQSTRDGGIGLLHLGDVDTDDTDDEERVVEMKELPTETGDCTSDDVTSDRDTEPPAIIFKKSKTRQHIRSRRTADDDNDAAV